MSEDKKDKKISKHRHTGLAVFITILILLSWAVGGAGCAYYRGWVDGQLQQSVVQTFSTLHRAPILVTMSLVLFQLHAAADLTACHQALLSPSTVLTRA